MPATPWPTRVRARLAIVVLIILVCLAWVPGLQHELRGAEVPRAIADWPVEGFGNHRARIAVGEKADIVRARIPWRRRDAMPERKDIIVVDAASGKRVDDVLRVEVGRERGDLLLRPRAAPGEYHVYWMPFRTEGWSAFPSIVYLPPREAADPAWLASCATAVERIHRGEDPGIPEAAVLDIQAVRDFHRFDPMEVPATAAEAAALLHRYPDRSWLLFPEDREHPIRMRDELPLRWIERGPTDEIRGEARRGEFFAFQLGLHAARQPLDDISVDFGTMSCSGGASIPAAALRCFNLGGTDWLGRPFRKALGVERGMIQPLWIGVAVPRDAVPGDYEGMVTVRPRNAAAQAARVHLRVLEGILDDAGDGDLARLSRLRWLDSTLGIDDETFGAYPPIRVDDRKLEVLGRGIDLGGAGLPASIRSAFSRSVGTADGAPEEILAAPMELVVVRGGAPVTWRGDEPHMKSVAPGAVAWEASASDGGGSAVALLTKARLECDGHIRFDLELRCAEACDLDDVSLRIPLRRAVATYMMGLGRKGGRRPAEWDWKWDPARANSHVWIGDVHAGLHLKLLDIEDRWDLYDLRSSGPYRDWGTGGASVREERGPAGEDRVVIRAFTGARHVAAGESLRLRFSLLVTPVKTLDPRHWSWRYFHQGDAPRVADVAASGATVINLHHGTGLNPHINYPFLTADELAAYASEAHAKDLKVKIYYTVRELSDHATEFWALRSLGTEVFLDGPGFRLADPDRKPEGGAPRMGDSWLCEHPITGYVPAWHQPLGNGVVDAAVAMQGLSRWHNHYLEGLAWLVLSAGIDGLYLDGIGYDREIMKRVRKVLDRTRKGCLIDFHSGNNFHPDYGLNNCASQYLEHFPFIDSLWFGEGFDYEETPDYWLVEISGIPFGLYGEMLQGGGNPWRGMLWGMTSRLGWGGDPRPIWKLWDEFGIESAALVGYWDPACPVKTGREDILATAYVQRGAALIALASWAKEPARVRLSTDCGAIGLDPSRAHLWAPPVPGFQPEALFAPDGEIPVPPGRGWLLLLEDRRRDLPPPSDPAAGRPALIEERFHGERLAAEWSARLSTRSGTRLRPSDGGLVIEAAANSAAFIERACPPGAALVVCRVDARTDRGASWGPGVALVWPDGKTLRVNLRAEGRFGVDDGARQILDGITWPGLVHELAIRLDGDAVLVQASHDARAWQTLARFPRAEFPGEPAAIRVGKMSPGARPDDFAEPGPDGSCSILDVRVLGASPAGPSAVR